jgi:alkanesulfonate monooxygenase SsuD/methylene tetrahydromethanopterin reductase-like flavin-dependent oxidoreductase (luciferase family)
MLSEPGVPVSDAWITMAAVATATREIRFGAMVTPLSRRRPWVMARQIAALDQLSGGRLVVGIGLGDDGWQEFSSFGEVVPARQRGLILDESLEVLRRLLSGEDVSYEGDGLTVQSSPFLPRPVQDPVPIWAACRWPKLRPLARAARVQGCFPIFGVSDAPDVPAADDLNALQAELARLGAPPTHDLVVRCALRNVRPADRASALATLEGCGVTWVLEGFPPFQPAAEIEAVVAAGPPPV